MADQTQTLQIVLEEKGTLSSPVSVTVNKSTNLHKLKLSLMESTFSQKLGELPAHRIKLSRVRPDNTQEDLPPHKEVRAYNFTDQDTIVVRIMEEKRLSAHFTATEESSTSTSETSSEPTRANSVPPERPTKAPSQTGHSVHYQQHNIGTNQTGPSKARLAAPPLIKFSPEQLAKDQEKVGKHLPNDQSVKESYECKAQLPGSRSAANGKLYLSQQCVLFVGKKKLKVVKLWQSGDVLDFFVHDKSLKLVEENLKQVIFTFTEDSARDQVLRNARKTLYHVGNTGLHYAIQCCDIERVKTIMQNFPESLSEFNNDQQTPLMYAAFLTENDIDLTPAREAERVKLFEEMVKFYEKNVDKVDINQKTPKGGHHILHTVCRLNHPEKILPLLLNFPNIDINTPVFHDETTPLHYFVRCHESHDCVTIGEMFFVHGSKVNALTNQHETPLHHAMMNKKVRGMMVELLLKHQADVNVRGGSNNDTPLCYAIRLGRSDLINKLLEAGTDITLLNNDDPPCNAIQLAAREYEKNAKGENPGQYLKNLLTLQNVDTLRESLAKANGSNLLGLLVKNLSAVTGLEDMNAILKNLESPQFVSKLGLVVGPKIALENAVKDLKSQLEQVKKKKEVEEALKRHSSYVTDANELRHELGITDKDNEIPGSSLEFTAKLGAGAYGAVFKGFVKPNTAVPVAIKILFGADLTEFKKEFQILRSVSGPNIVKFYGFCIDKHLGMVMEFCEKGSLFDILKKNDPALTWKQALDYAIGMAKGMTILHSHKPPIFHRDMKSLNLLVTRDNIVKVCDFGLSRLVEQGASNMQTFKNLRGTMAYCAPEIMDGVHQFTDKSDVYSMGIVLWELIYVAVTAKYEQPFAEYGLAVEFAIIYQATSGKRPTLPANTPNLMANLYFQCVDPAPEKRPSTEKLVAELQSISEKFTANEKTWLSDVYSASANSSATPAAAQGKTEFKGWGNKKS